MTRGSGLLRATVVAGLLTVAVGGCNHGQSSPTTSNATVITRFTPYSAAGVLTVPLNAHGTGHCWTASIEVPVVGAYRCLVGNDITDPCFAPPRATAAATVACMPDPWSGAQVVTLTQPLPNATPIGNAAKPWAVQLANGARCVAATGTTQSVDGVSLNLLCPGGMAAGGLDRNGPLWHVKYGPATGGSLSSVDVTAAWRG